MMGQWVRWVMGQWANGSMGHGSRIGFVDSEKMDWVSYSDLYASLIVFLVAPKMTKLLTELSIKPTNKVMAFN